MLNTYAISFAQNGEQYAIPVPKCSGMGILLILHVTLLLVVPIENVKMTDSLRYCAILWVLLVLLLGEVMVKKEDESRFQRKHMGPWTLL